jgi:type I restriction enzyme M protein
MFVQSEKFIQAHGGKRDDASIYGQESNPTTWRLAAMNLAIRGFAADLGQEPADTFARDQFPDQKFDYILATVPIRKVVRSGCLNCAPLCSLHQFEP